MLSPVDDVDWFMQNGSWEDVCVFCVCVLCVFLHFAGQFKSVGGSWGVIEIAATQVSERQPSDKQEPPWPAWIKFSGGNTPVSETTLVLDDAVLGEIRIRGQVSDGAHSGDVNVYSSVTRQNQNIHPPLSRLGVACIHSQLSKHRKFRGSMVMFR